MTAERNPPRAPRYPCRVTSTQYPQLLFDQPARPGYINFIAVEGIYSEAEFAAAFPGLEIRECLYASGETSNGVSIIPLYPSLLTNGWLGCFASLIAGETAAQEGREKDWEQEAIDRHVRWALDNTRPYTEIPMEVLQKILNLAEGYPELADREALHDPQVIEAAGHDGYSMGLTPAVLCRPFPEAAPAAE